MRLSSGVLSTVMTATRSGYLGDEIAEKRRHVENYCRKHVVRQL